MKRTAFAFTCASLIGWAVPAMSLLAAESVPAPATPAAVSPTPTGRHPVESLMFTTEEYNDIQGRLAGGNEAKDKDTRGIENAGLYLSSIVYTNPKQWTIWINDTPIGPDQDFQAFQVTSITPTYVELLVPLSAQGMRPIRLEPNQTFMAKSGTIVEGRFR